MSSERASHVLIERLKNEGDKEEGSGSKPSAVTRASARVHVKREHGAQSSGVKRVREVREAPRIGAPRLEVEHQEPKVRKQWREASRRYATRQKLCYGRTADYTGTEMGTKDWPVIISAEGRLSVVTAMVCRGKGLRQVNAGLDDLGIEAAQVAISFVAINAPVLASWVRGRAGSKDDAFIYDKHTDLVVTQSALGAKKSGGSGAACAALALVLKLGSRLKRDKVVRMTGYLDLRGRMHVVGAVDKKIQHACEKGLYTFIIPADNLMLLEREGGLPQGDKEKQYMQESVKCARTFVDVLDHSIEGFQRKDGMWEEELDGPHIGLGRCLGLAGQGVGDFQVQCCYLKAGSCSMRLTGGLSQVSKEAICNIKHMVEEASGLIAALFHLPPKDFKLVKRHHDIHVHIEHLFQPISGTYQMGAIFVSFVSLVLGRRPRDDTIIFADVGNATSCLSGGWEFDAFYIECCAHVKYRRVIVGDLKLTEEAAKAAAVIQADGRPLVEFVVKNKILEALPLCFEE